MLVVLVGRTPMLLRCGGLLACRHGAGGQGLRCFPKLGHRSPFTPNHHFCGAPMNGESTQSWVVETFCRWEELILPQTDPANPHFCSVKEKKGIEMKNKSTSNREISI